MISSEAELKEALPGGLVPFLDKAFNKNYSFDKFSETDLLNAAAKLVDAHDEMDGALKQAFKDAKTKHSHQQTQWQNCPCKFLTRETWGHLASGTVKQIEVEKLKRI